MSMQHHPGKGMIITRWILKVVLAGAFAFFALPKLTGDPVSIELFTTLGVEPWGRMAAGIIELAAAVLILVPRTVLIGAGLAAMTMLGAIGSHATKLGFEGDYGVMAGIAFVLLVLSGVIIVLQVRRDAPTLASDAVATP